MMEKCGNVFLLVLFAVLPLVSGCGGKKSGSSMSEFEQLKYEKTSEKLNTLYAEAGDVAASGSSDQRYHLEEEIADLDYSFDGDNMSDEDRQKCQALADRIKALKANPDEIFKGRNVQPTGLKGVAISRTNASVNGLLQLPCCLNAGDVVTLHVDCSGPSTISFYDVSHQQLLKSWKTNADGELVITSRGIYLVEVSSKDNGAKANVELSYQGKDGTPRPQVGVRYVDCKAGDFLASPMNAIIAKKVFDQPKKIGLRGQLKVLFSGKGRALVPIPVPKHCDALLYSLRISTNENTVSSDGKFADNLSAYSKSIRLFGVNVYEKRISSGIIDRLLFNTRPPREDDAFCNMYVFTNRAQAKKFQDGTASSGSYKYDVDQSQMGTQSCNGRLYSKGNSVIYMGFENERMRYDNYIWLEVVALKHSLKYQRPIYYTR